MRVPYSWLMEYLDADLSPEELAEALTMGGLEVEEIRDWTSEDGEATDKIFVTKVTANRGDMLSMLGVARQAAAVLQTSYKLPDIPMEIVSDPVSGETMVSDGTVTVELADTKGCPRYSALRLRDVKLGPSPKWLAHRLESAGMRPLANVVDCTNYVMLELGQPLHAFDFKLLRKGHVIVRKATEGEKILTLDRQWRTLDEGDLLITDPAGPAALAGVMGGADTEINEKSVEILLESAHFDPTTIRKTSLRLGLSSEASYRFERHVDPNGTLRALARVTQLIQQVAGGEVIGKAIDACAEDFSPRQITLRPERVNQILGTDFTPEVMARCLRSIDCEVEILESVGVASCATGPADCTTEKSAGPVAHDATPTDSSHLVLQVGVPRLRWDIEREIDLIEEIAIVYGYENLPMTVPGKLSQSGLLTRRQKLTRQVGEVLRQCGLNETLSFSVSCPADMDRLCYVPQAPQRTMLPLANPMIDTQSHMRTTLLPALLEACENNVHQRVTDVALYEINKVFVPVDGTLLPEEPMRVAGVVMGSLLTAEWNLPEEMKQPDFYLLKGMVEQVCDALGVADARYERTEHPSFHPGRCAKLVIDGKEAGVFGEIAASVQEAYDLPTRAYLFELDLETLLTAACQFKQYEPLARYPAIGRDLAIVMPDDDAHTAARVVNLIAEAGGEHLREVEPFDLFVDAKRLGAGLKSVAFQMQFRATDRTLTDEEVDAAMARIKESIAAQTQGKIRDY
ncbi:MAG: phenylalanine--tRNA ligase subunit beta [Armatimonadota bacterium]